MVLSAKLIARTTIVTLLLFVAALQLGIAATLVNPNITWKASFDRWSWKLCVLSMFAASILLSWAWVIHHRPNRWVYTGTTLYMTLNTLGNLTSDNAFEKYIFGTITGIIALCSAFLACTTEMSASEYENIDARALPRDTK